MKWWWLCTAAWVSAQFCTNEDCASALSVDGGVGACFVQTGPLDSAVTSTCATSNKRDLWFTYTAQCDGSVFISANGLFAGSGAVVMCVFTGSCGSLNQVQCENTDYATQEILLWSVTEGTKYMIQLGFSATPSLVTVTIDCVPPAINDVCATAADVGQLARVNVGRGSTGGFGTVATGSGCDYSLDTWYKYTANFTGMALFNVSTPQFYADIVLVAWTGDCSNLGTPTCIDDHNWAYGEDISFRVQSGKTYYFSLGLYDQCITNYNKTNCTANDYLLLNCWTGDVEFDLTANPDPIAPTPSPAGQGALIGGIVGGVIGGIALLTIVVFCCRRSAAKKRTDYIAQDTKEEPKAKHGRTEEEKLATAQFKDLRVLEQLGQGAFGTVHRCVWAGTDYAVKQLVNPAGQRDFEKELEVNRLLAPSPHTCVVRAICITHAPPALVMELYPLRSVEQYVLQGGNLSKPEDFPKLLTVLINASAGVLHLHAHKVIHRDIAARNFLIKEDLSTSVCDFGLSLFLNDGNSTGTLTREQRLEERLPINISAPETLANGEYGFSSDVWMFGMFLWEMLARRTPFADRPELQSKPPNVRELVRQIRLGAQPELPPAWPAPLVALMRRCWSLYPHERPSMALVNEELRVFREVVVAQKIPLPAFMGSPNYASPQAELDGYVNADHYDLADGYAVVQPVGQNPQVPAPGRDYYIAPGGLPNGGYYVTTQDGGAMYLVPQGAIQPAPFQMQSFGQPGAPGVVFMAVPAPGTALPTPITVPVPGRDYILGDQFGEFPPPLTTDAPPPSYETQDTA